MIPADSLLLGAVASIVADLTRGRVVDFAATEGGPLAFTMERTGGAIVMRCPQGRALASGSTFAEVWRKRPR